MSFEELGKWLIIGGLVMAATGALVWLLGHIPFFGNLAGDIRIQTNNFGCFFPIVSMIVLSIIATVVLNIIIRIVNK